MYMYLYNSFCPAPPLPFPSAFWRQKRRSGLRACALPRGRSPQRRGLARSAALAVPPLSGDLAEALRRRALLFKRCGGSCGRRPKPFVFGHDRPLGEQPVRSPRLREHRRRKVPAPPAPCLPGGGRG